MALTQCPKCGNQVSDRATSCPHCGCPIRPAPAPTGWLASAEVAPPWRARPLGFEGQVLFFMAATGFVYGLEMMRALVPVLAGFGVLLVIILIAYKVRQQGWPLYRAVLYASALAIFGFALGYLFDWLYMHYF